MAKRSNLPPKTIRYYERIGLLRPAGRAANGYRAYDVTDDRTRSTLSEAIRGWF